ncbi:MAG TPA: FecR family protein [Chloroflexota bacterium]
MSVTVQPKPSAAAAANGHTAEALASGASAFAARKRERLAWVVLLSSFALFVVVGAGLVLGVRWYREEALSARAASLDDIIEGTVLQQSEQVVRETVASKGQRLQDGDRIRTDQNGKALIKLPDGSNVTLWPNTTLEIRQLRASTYTDNRSVFVLAQLSGHARVHVAVPSTLERRFEIQTPHGRVVLREGSYRLEVGPAGTELAVGEGSASLTGKERTVEVLRGERSSVSAGGDPARPADAERNLIRNGDFLQGFEGWRIGSRDEEDGVLGQVNLERVDGRFAIRLRRQGSVRHGEAFIQQTIGRDVTDEASLKLQLDTRVIQQSLSGGGVLGTEYPLLVRLRYRDYYGSENEIVRGLYVRNPEARPTTNGYQVPANQWLPITIDLFDDRLVQPRPAYLMWVEVEGGGWEFESFVTGIQILAE